jgi:hypothetical protein
MKNSREMTLQDVFNVVWERAKNPVKSMTACDDGSDYDCLYRGPNSLKCFIGECIADEDYKESFEGKPVSNPIIKDLFPLCWNSLRTLQTIHDDYEPNDWRKELDIYAKDRGLSIPG